MAETDRARQIASYRASAASIAQENQQLIPHPMARFNLGLDGENWEWQPTLESGLPPVQELAEPTIIAEEMVDPLTSQKMNTIRANWDKFSPSQPVVVMPSAYYSEIEKGSPNYRITEAARLMPDTPFFAYDHPHNGGSDNLRPEQRTTSKEKSYAATADTVLRILAEQGVNQIVPVGFSMGAFAALAIAAKAAEHEIEVKQIVLHELPGVRHIFSLIYAKHFFSNEKYNALYKSWPFDPAMFDAHQPTAEEKQGVGKIERVKDMLKHDPLFMYARSMAKKTAPKRIKQVLQTQPTLEKIVFVNGTLTKISSAEGIAKIIKKLKKKGYGEKLRQIIFPGEPHSLVTQGKRFAAITKLALTGQAL